MYHGTLPSHPFLSEHAFAESSSAPYCFYLRTLHPAHHQPPIFSTSLSCNTNSYALAHSYHTTYASLYVTLWKLKDLLRAV